MIIGIYKLKDCNVQIIIEDKFVKSISIKEDDFKSITYIKKINDEAKKGEKEILDQVIRQIEDYLSAKRKEFDLNLFFDVSPFSKKVYKALINTNYGSVYKCKDIAKKINSPNASRAVGSCMKKNPFAFVVPCHRVIKNEKDVGNYFIQGDLKKNLLKMEKENK